MLFYKCVTSLVFYVIENNLDKHKCNEYVKLFTTEICIELYNTPMYNYSRVQNWSDSVIYRSFVNLYSVFQHWVVSFQAFNSTMV